MTLFERHARPGFVAHAVAVDGVEVDVPVRVFYPGYYPTLVRLYRELGVPSEPVNYASSFTGEDGVPFFRYRNLLVGARSWSYVLPQDLRHAPARRVLAGALRFRRQARVALESGTLAGRTIGEFVAALELPREFVDGLLLPAIATICTCPYDAARAFPAATIVEYLERGVTREAVRRAVPGAQAVVERVLGALEEVALSAPVSGLRRDDGGVRLQRADRAGRPFDRLDRLDRLDRFDHVVLATQANQALALLDDAAPAERALLAAFDYRPIEVLMHHDERLMPRARRHWSAVNLLVAPQALQPQSTIWLNAVMPALRARLPVFQTVHPLVAPREEHVIARTRLERPVVSAASEAALAALERLHAEPGRRLWFCGSYAERGVPLLESAVRSAARVVERIGRG